MRDVWFDFVHPAIRLVIPDGWDVFSYRGVLVRIEPDGRLTRLESH